MSESKQSSVRYRTNRGLTGGCFMTFEKVIPWRIVCSCSIPKRMSRGVGITGFLQRALLLSFFIVSNRTSYMSCPASSDPMYPGETSTRRLRRLWVARVESPCSTLH